MPTGFDMRGGSEDVLRFMLQRIRAGAEVVVLREKRRQFSQEGMERNRTGWAARGVCICGAKQKTRVCMTKRLTRTGEETIAMDG